MFLDFSTRRKLCCRSSMDRYFRSSARRMVAGCLAVRTRRALQLVSPVIYPPYVTARPVCISSLVRYVLTVCDQFGSRSGRKITFQKHTTVCNLRGLGGCLLVGNRRLWQRLPQTPNPPTPAKESESVSPKVSEGSVPVPLPALPMRYKVPYDVCYVLLYSTSK